MNGESDRMKESTVYNVDCMEYMKTLPDKAFDLAVVDPPYGDALQERLEPLRSTIRPIQAPDRLRFSGRNRYNCGGAGTGRERTSENQTERGVMRTGGTWAEKYAKKS